MSRESREDRSQKTVAELLALHGGNIEGRRRRRRAADDDAPEENEGPRRAQDPTETGPQAIIDRVRADGAGPNGAPPGRNGGRRAMPDSPGRQDSGGFRRPEQGPPPGPPAPPGQQVPPGHAGPPGPPGQQSSAAMPRPVLPDNPGQPVPPGQQSSAALPRPVTPEPPVAPGQPVPPGQQSSAALPRPVTPEPPGPGAPPRRGQQDSGGFARPKTGALPPPPQDSMPLRRPHPQDSGFVRRPPQESGALPLPPQESGALPVPPAEAVPPLRRRPPGEETSTGLAARLDGLDAPVDPDAPPAGGRATGTFPPPRRPRRAPARATPPPDPSTEQFEPVGEVKPAEEPAPDAPPAGLSAPPAGLQRWRRGREETPAEEETEVGLMPPVRDAPDADEPTGFHAPPHLPGRPPQDDPGEALEATGFHDPFADDDDDVNEFGDFGPAEEAAEQPYDYDDEPAADADEPARAKKREAEPSPAKQWLSMAGQLAGGVVGGAAVWLGFNWLWGQIPAAALIAALVVIVGLVWIVRRIRRADDIQTTVLAVLVGLVVTVSPAALLLLSR
ncbi:hypothetical protein [Amycolatopsis methanolica]|uniref:Basic proline-rich protein n=1 Tax=Amycolatopsis methanolica 239 TaxID=1068978 RepID=A0A076MI23_AMYME|nr:hypothetical protein [Amycolatopsis methanolica]AIJ20523.1 hypothetical protein AMETH_0431 [Amycolatopsis methanolica 239]